jgi:predicted nucleic acid-binding protein
MNGYLVDTDVISESRKGAKANRGVRSFFTTAGQQNIALYISAVTLGELRRGVEKVRHRGDDVQAKMLERWLQRIVTEYSDSVLGFDSEIAQLWGLLRVPNPENPLDKQIAATAIIYDLAVVTRNVSHFVRTGVAVHNPFR